MLVASNVPASLQLVGPGTLVPNQIIPRPLDSPTPAPDPGNPLAVLNNRGITKGNKTNISALAAALESFGEFKRGTTWNIGKEWAMQLMAITKLL